MPMTNIICEYDGECHSLIQEEITLETNENAICKWIFGLDSQIIAIIVEKFLNTKDVCRTEYLPLYQKL